MDSTGVHALVDARRRLEAQNRRLAIVCRDGGQVHRLLALVGLLDAMAVYRSRESAVIGGDDVILCEPDRTGGPSRRASADPEPSISPANARRLTSAAPGRASWPDREGRTEMRWTTPGTPLCGPSRHLAPRNPLAGGPMTATIMQTRELARLTDEELLDTHYREGDLAARDELMVRFMPFARKLAHRYMHSREPMDDLVQVASIGLLNAIDRFDPERGKSSLHLPPLRSSASSGVTFATRDGRSTFRVSSRNKCSR